LAAGQYTVGVVARGIRDRAARATTQHRLLLGGQLPLATAGRLARRAGLPAFVGAHRADTLPTEAFTSGACHRVLATRVDCQVGYSLSDSDENEDDCYLQAVTLQPSGVVTLRAYARRPRSCSKRRPLSVQAHPRWDSPRIQAPPL
jgi:hypothetical protein